MGFLKKPQEIFESGEDGHSIFLPVRKPLTVM